MALNLPSAVLNISVIFNGQAEFPTMHQIADT